jgi:hypothetical protein
MLVWSRFGFLGILIPIIISIGASSLIDSVLGKDYFSSKVIFGACFILSSPIIWFLGKKLNSGAERTLLDPTTNQTVILKENHTIFWMPLEYFAVIAIALGLFWISVP